MTLADIDWTHVAIGAVAGGLVAGVAAYLLDPLRSLPEWRKTLLATARQYADAAVPYQWGGGRSPSDYGVDCSGLILRAMEAAGYPPKPAAGLTSTVWWQTLPRVAAPVPGDLAFYGADGVTAHHVVMVTSYDPASGIATITGANGGDKSVTSPDVAAAKGAFVRSEPTHLYRPDFLGFATLDPAAQAAGSVSYLRRIGRPTLCCD